MGDDYKPGDRRKQDQTISGLIASIYRAGTVPAMDSLGTRVKQLRVARRMTQVALAKALGISQPALSMIETGATESLSGEVLASMCRELITTPDFLLYGAASEAGFELALQMAEVSSIMQRLPQQAREALLDQARLLARATAVKPSVNDPFGKGIPERREDDRRKVDLPVTPDRRKH